MSRSNVNLPAFGSTDSISRILKELAKERKLFWKEADFQFAFAWKLKELYPTADIRLERTFVCDNSSVTQTAKASRNADENIKVVMNIDIWVKIDEIVYPIELKYKTKALNTKDPEETITDFDCEKISLNNQSAHDISRHAFIKDIHRLETILDCKTADLKFGCGFAIFLSNDPAFWKVRAQQFKDNRASGPIDFNFSIHGNIVRGDHEWINPEAKVAKLGKISLRSDYPVEWKEYSSGAEQETVLFKYLILQIR